MNFSNERKVIRKLSNSLEGHMGNRKATILVSCHKKDVFTPRNGIMKQIQVGAAEASERFPHMLHDDIGGNISKLNPFYCEVTAQYWAWKNLHVDYYGFFHYRRYFIFNENEYEVTHRPYIFGDVVRPVNGFRTLREFGITKNNILSYIKKYPLIIPKRTIHPEKITVYEQYCGSAGQKNKDLDIALGIIEKYYPDYKSATSQYMNSHSGYYCNMFIMEKALFHEYCRWLFPILEKHAEESEMLNSPKDSARVSGYLAERLFGVYITKLLTDQNIEHKELYRAYFENTDLSLWKKCLINLLLH